MSTIIIESKTTGGLLQGVQRWQRVYRRKPVDKSTPLPYLVYGHTFKPEYTGNALSDLTMRGYGIQNPTIARAYAKAYDKFVEKAKQDATIQMGANLAEAKETLDMIASRAGQLLTLARDLKRGKLPFGRKKRREASRRDPLWKKPGGWWLEYHFAWAPLISDIYTGCEMLSSPVWDLTPVKERGAASDRIDRSHGRDWRVAEVDISEIKATVTIQGNVRVTNPNLYLLNRVGLINPASVAWEVVPFSFAVDWFLPVSAYLSSYTDSVGWQLERGIVSMKDTCKSTHVIDGSDSRPSQAERFQRDVVTSLQIPGLFDRRGNGIRSITRGATAIALLVGFLRG